MRIGNVLATVAAASLHEEERHFVIAWRYAGHGVFDRPVVPALDGHDLCGIATRRDYRVCREVDVRGVAEVGGGAVRAGEEGAGIRERVLKPDSALCIDKLGSAAVDIKLDVVQAVEEREGICKGDFVGEITGCESSESSTPGIHP